MISVIVTTYKRPKKLSKAIESILNQTFQDFEIIVVNDDNKEQLKFDNPKIRVMNATKNFGNDTRPKNTGIWESKGDLIAFLDDDNTWRPDHLQALHKELEENPDVALVYGDRWVTDERDRIKPQLGVHSDFNPFLLMEQNYIDTSDVLVRKEALEYVGGFDERYRKYIDWNLWIRLAKAGFKFKRVPVIITDYMISKDSKSERPEDEKSIGVPAWEAQDLKIRLDYLGDIKPPKVAIFTLTYDRLDYTKQSFKSLKETAGYDFDHYVIDNGSTDGTSSWLPEQVKASIFNDENKGISIASNQALNMIGDKYDIIGKVDNDCLFLTQDWLKKIVEVWEVNHMIALSPYVQGLRDNPGGAPRFARGMLQETVLGFTKHLGGICHFVSSNAYKDFRWDEESALHGVQDLELSKHLLNRGYGMAYLENYYVDHIEGTHGQEQKYPHYFERRKTEKVTSYQESKEAKSRR